MSKDTAEEKKSGYAFGTFKGVFTPSILTILGVIMYLRFGWVLGNLGLPGTLLVVTLACLITFLTGLSLSALATNMKVGGGGAYYIISRSLGIEAGGAIGVPLYFAQALGIAFYITGFSEALTDVMPHWNPRIVGTATLVVLALIATLSADLALKSQYLVFAVIIASLISFFLGTSSESLPLVNAEPVIPRETFWVVFAVFFPAVTGIEAGVSMSGDLKSPARSLPRGTLLAVGVGYCVYMAIPIYMNSVVPHPDLLIQDTFIMRRLARWGDLVLLGVWAASLSSATGALLGAPRTLQALARDGVVPRFLGRSSGTDGDPRSATVFSFCVALATIWIGDLNLIAPLLTMFFLTSYGLLNFSAGIEQLVGSPHWRPEFRIPTVIPLLGAAACLVTMFMINAGATFLASIVAGSVYAVMKRRQLQGNWGDIRYGMLMLLARYSIFRLTEHRADFRNWTPNVLVLSGSPTTRWHLIEFAQALAGNDGCLTIATLIPEEAWSAEKEENLEKSIVTYLRRRDIDAIVKILPSDSVPAGAESLIKAYGFGPIVPNTIILGLTSQLPDFARYARMIHLANRCRRNLVILSESEAPADPESQFSVIDIWWRGTRRNIGFMLAISELLRRRSRRDAPKIRIKTIVDSQEEAREAELRLDQLISDQRFDAEAVVITRSASGSAYDVIRDSSADADLVFLGMRAPADEDLPEDDARAYYQNLIESMRGFRAAALVLAAEDIHFECMTDGASRT